MTTTKERLEENNCCTAPDRDAPNLFCGYPLPCPHHSVMVVVPQQVARRMQKGAPVDHTALETIFDTKWRTALRQHMNRKEYRDFIRVPISSVVGTACKKLHDGIDAVDKLGLEADDRAVIMAAAAHTMAIWYFG